MTATVQELVDRRAGIWQQMQEIYDRRDITTGLLSAEDSAAYERAEADFDALEAEVTRAQRHAALAASMSQVDRTGVTPPNGVPPSQEVQDEEYARAFSAFLREGINDLEPAQRKLMQDRRRDLPKGAAGVGTGAAGGYAVPPEFRNIFIETLKWYGPMLDVAETFSTDSGANIPWPTNDDTANVGAILAENTQVTEQDVTLGTNALDAYMYTSKLVRVSFQLLQDRPDFDTWLARKLGERIGRIWNQHFTTGTGVSQPDGFVTSAAVGGTGTGSFAGGNSFTYDTLIDVLESLDPAYGAGDGLTWMMHQTARKVIRKMKDTQNRPLWEPSIQAGTPDSLMGYPVRLNNDMPTLAQSSKSVAFGNFREAYVIRQVRDIATLRLTERYADYLQVGFLAFARADGTLQNGNALRLLQTTTTA